MIFKEYSLIKGYWSTQEPESKNINPVQHANEVHGSALSAFSGIANGRNAAVML